MWKHEQGRECSDTSQERAQGCVCVCVFVCVQAQEGCGATEHRARISMEVCAGASAGADRSK